MGIWLARVFAAAAGIDTLLIGIAEVIIILIVGLTSSAIGLRAADSLLAALGGLLVFAIAPALRTRQWQQAMRLSTLLGAVAYGTYDLSNLATLQGWSASLTVVDILWGAVASAIAGGRVPLKFGWFSGKPRRPPPVAGIDQTGRCCSSARRTPRSHPPEASMSGPATSASWATGVRCSPPRRKRGR